MGTSKKYFWLKLKDDFFNQKEIKKLRKIAGGDTFTIIYLKLQLLSIKKEGVITYEGTERNLAEQLSLEIDEDIDNIEVTLSFLVKNNLIEKVEENDYLLPKVMECIGKETDSAERVRRHRERKALELQEKQEKMLLEDNNTVTSPLQCNTETLQCNTEKEKEKEKDIYSVFEKWNSTSVGINHRDITDFKPSIRKAIESYKLENVLKAIERLDAAFSDNNYFYKQKWNLKNFLKQSNGISNWLDEGQNYMNYIAKASKTPLTKKAEINFEDFIQ